MARRAPISPILGSANAASSNFNIAFFGECMVEISGSPCLKFGGDTLNTALYLSRLTQNKNLLVHYATGLGGDELSPRYD
ncbi:hypothetical protein OK016_27340 [Vibrio chagasii]|nr:hypothetical protein [Vibrio chagasii]